MLEAQSIRVPIDGMRWQIKFHVSLFALPQLIVLAAPYLCLLARILNHLIRNNLDILVVKNVEAFVPVWDTYGKVYGLVIISDTDAFIYQRWVIWQLVVHFVDVVVASEYVGGDLVYKLGSQDHVAEKRENTTKQWSLPKFNLFLHRLSVRQIITSLAILIWRQDLL